MAAVYLLNSPVLTAYGDYSFSGPLTVEQARSELEAGFVSAIGHAGAAEFLHSILDLPVAVDRRTIEMQAGDRAVILRLKTRLPENRSLTAEETAAFPFDLALLRRVR